jgi:hypothetical protein
MNTFWKVFTGLLTIGVIVSLVTLFSGSQPVGAENLIGRELPGFAAPLASGTQTGDANVYTEAQAKSLKSTAACDVNLPGVFNSCRDLKGDAILAFWNTTKRECVNDVATLDAFARRNKDVSVAAVAFEQTEASARAMVQKRGFKLPVPIDRDGAVAALYSVAGCPTTFFAHDGELTGVILGVLSAPQLTRGLGATGATN